MEELSTLNVRLTYKGKRERIIDLHKQILDLIKEDVDIVRSSIDFNDFKDTK